MCFAIITTNNNVGKTMVKIYKNTIRNNILLIKLALKIA